ncbi:DUF4113 domain-containing protein [Cronobacter dublinensis]
MHGHNQQGRATLYSAGPGTQQLWQVKREMLSPCYISRLADVPTARAWQKWWCSDIYNAKSCPL